MTVANGDLSRRNGSSDEPSSPTGRQTGSAPSKKSRAHTGRRLFAFDRSLGRRFVAGADEAGRGSLAGPLFAAAVMFDLEQLTLSERRSLTRLNDCKQHAAASVLAKVTRDRYMRRAADRHPGWDFETNVGYSTPEHRAAIAMNGVSPLHRLSFASIAYQQLHLGG